MGWFNTETGQTDGAFLSVRFTISPVSLANHIAFHFHPVERWNCVCSVRAIGWADDGHVITQSLCSRHVTHQSLMCTILIRFLTRSPLIPRTPSSSAIYAQRPPNQYPRLHLPSPSQIDVSPRYRIIAQSMMFPADGSVRKGRRV